MDIKTQNVPTNTVTRTLSDLDAATGNIYETVNIIAKRANQINSEIKQESKSSSKAKSVTANVTPKRTISSKHEASASTHCPQCHCKENISCWESQEA